MTAYADLSTTPPLPGLLGIPDINANFAAIMAALFPSSLSINDDFSVWQNSAALGSTAVTDDTYTSCDGYYVLTQTASINAIQQTVAENGAPVSLRLTQSQAAAQRFGLAQVIEAQDSQRWRGSDITFQPRIRCSSSQAIRYALCEWTGTADVVTSDIVLSWVSSTYTPNNFFLAASLNVLVVGAVTPTANVWTDLAAITGLVGNSANNLILFVWTEGTAAQNVTLDFDRVLLQPGDSIFKQARLPYEMNLARCQRHYLYLDAPSANALQMRAFADTTTVALGQYYFLNPLRTRPSGITVNNPTNFQVRRQAAGAVALTALAFSDGDTRSVVLQATVAAGLTAGEGCAIRSNNTNCAIIIDVRL